MKIRMQFAKYGRMLYIGHLDVMRYFQKALRRAEVPMVFTKGFSPHPILSFAAPLVVGIESGAEYADLEVYESGSSAEMIEKLNRAMVPGMEIIDWRQIPDDAPNAMSSVAAADYCLTFRAGKGPENMDEYLDGLERFLQNESILIEKKTKKGSRELDIRPLIYEYKLQKGDEPAVFLQVCTGSVDNLKPELVLAAYHDAAGLTYPENDLFISRLETYTNVSSEEGKRNLVPLREIGAVIQ